MASEFFPLAYQNLHSNCCFFMLGFHDNVNKTTPSMNKQNTFVILTVIFISQSILITGLCRRHFFVIPKSLVWFGRIRTYNH